MIKKDGDSHCADFNVWLPEWWYGYKIKDKEGLGMDNKQKYDLYYKLWEHHSNLLWSKLQYVIAIMVAINTAWFLLLRLFLSEEQYSNLYFIISIFLCLFGIIINIYLKRLVKRDVTQQKYYEKKLSCVFGKLKKETTPKKTRGRYIVKRMFNWCLCLYIFLICISVASFWLKYNKR